MPVNVAHEYKLSGQKGNMTLFQPNFTDNKT